MVDITSIERQLKRVGFNHRGWGRTEIRELQHIILPDEEIFECVNGIYEGGFAILVATDVRVLLVDKKPLNYLTVEDLRFDMINEIDYNHRLIGAYIKISAGDTNLKFSSLNQARLRKLIGHVQFCMAQAKKQQAGHQQGQNQHLEQINQQLQAYLLAQYEQQQKLHEQLQDVKSSQEIVASVRQQAEPVRPSPELADYLFAQSLMAQHQAQVGGPAIQLRQPAAPLPAPAPAPAPTKTDPMPDQVADLYSEGIQEVFGKHDRRLQGDNIATASAQTPARSLPSLPFAQMAAAIHNPLEVNALSVAYSKLPMALRNRKFGRPSFHAHSQEAVSAPAPTEA